MFRVGLSPDMCFCKNCGIQIHKDRQCILKANSEERYCVNCRVCPDRHTLNYRYDLRDFGTGSYRDNIYSCDSCEQQRELGEGILTCPACKYDLCRDCQGRFFGQQ